MKHCASFPDNLHADMASQNRVYIVGPTRDVDGALDTDEAIMERFQRAANETTQNASPVRYTIYGRLLDVHVPRNFVKDVLALDREGVKKALLYLSNSNPRGRDEMDIVECLGGCVGPETEETEDQEALPDQRLL